MLQQFLVEMEDFFIFSRLLVIIPVSVVSYKGLAHFSDEDGIGTLGLPSVVVQCTTCTVILSLVVKIVCSCA